MTLGASLPRTEDRRLLAGRGAYLADHAPRGALHAVFVRADHAHAHLVGIDTTDAKKIPGVVAVLTAADLPAATMSNARVPGLVATEQPVVARDRVRFVGEVVAVVLATSRYTAEDGAEAVVVDYEPLTPAVDAEEEPAADALLFASVEGNIIFDETKDFGDVDAAFASAACVVRRKLHFARQSASPIETRGCIAAYDPFTGRLTVRASTQSPHMMRRKLARVTGLAEHRVTVRVDDTGGAFGQKIPLHPEEAAVALVSVELGATVKWVEDRRENLMAGPHSREQHATVELAVADDGTFLGLRSDVLGDAGAYSFNAGSALTEPYLTARSMCGPYRIENYRYRCRARLTNKSPIAPYRGVGHVNAQIIRELLIDDAARETGVDPVELRRLNLVRDFPYTNAVGMVYDSGSYIECLDAAVGALRDGPGAVEATTPGCLVGIGVSSFVEPTAPGSKLVQEVWGTRSTEGDSVRVTLDPSGRATVAIGTPSQGQGIETTIAQVVAEELGLPLCDVTVIFGDTTAAPLSMTGTRSSRTAVITGGAAARASFEIKSSLRHVAAEMLEAAVEDITLDGGKLSVRGSGFTALTIEEVIQAGLTSPDIRARAGEPTFSSTQPFDPPAATYSNGCVAALVEVDPRTGGVRLLRVTVAHDCGTVINPAIVEGQVVGALVQGLGGALLEEVSYGPDGQPLTTSFMDYLLPTSSDTVRAEVIHFESPSPNTWRGVKGAGEAGTIGMTAAMVCAVADAVGEHARAIDRVPLRPATVAALFPDPTPRTVRSR